MGKKSIFAKCRVMYETSITTERTLKNNKQLLTKENVLFLAISSLEFNKWFKSLLTSQPEKCDQFYKNAFATLKSRKEPRLPPNQFKKIQKQIVQEPSPAFGCREAIQIHDKNRR